jgi:uridine phosphorylase
VEKIAALMDKPVKLASHREFTTGVLSWMVKP